MNVVESYCLLICGGLVAYVGTLIYCHLYRCIEVWNRKRQNKNELFKARCRKLHRAMKDYYVTIAVTQPNVVAKQLATVEVNKMIKNKTVLKNYTRLKKCSNI